MNRSYCALLGALLAASSSIAVAQAPVVPPADVATPAPATTAIIMSDPQPNVLRAGTKIPLKMSEPLTTKGKKLRVGQRFQLEVAEDVTLNGQIVIPAGSPATGEVTDVRNKGMWGKSGRINARVLYLRANGRQIRLTGTLDDKGVTGTAGVVAAIAFVPVAGFFTTGTSAQIPLGAPVTAFLDEDLTIAFAPAAAPAPMVVPVPAPQAVVASTAPSATSANPAIEAVVQPAAAATSASVASEPQ